MMESDDISDDKNELQEPSASYHTSGNKKLQIFSSFAEMQNAENISAATQTREQRLGETVQLILRAYGVTQEDLNKRKKSRHITITRYE